jgi:hypothetical protein
MPEFSSSQVQYKSHYVSMDEQIGWAVPLYDRRWVNDTNHVRGKLAPYEYLKEIEFIAASPMTANGIMHRCILRL